MFSLQKTSYEWISARSVSYPSKGGCFGNWIVFEILMLHFEFIIMQERNIEVCKDTAFTRILCFVDVLILRIPLNKNCYPLLLGFFWIWDIRIVWKRSFGLPDYQTSISPISFCRDVVYYFARPIMRRLVHYSLSFEELRVYVENSEMIGLETDWVVCCWYLPWTEGSFILHFAFDNVQMLHYLFLLTWVISLGL